MGRTKGYFRPILFFLWLVPTLTVLGRSTEFTTSVTNNRNDGYDNSQFKKSKIKNREEMDTSSNRVQRDYKVRHRNKLEEDIAIYGMSFEYSSDKKRVDYENGEIFIVEGLEVVLTLFGKFVDGTELRFTKSAYSCQDVDIVGSVPRVLKTIGESVRIQDHDVFSASTVNMVMPLKKNYTDTVYFCLRHPNKTEWNPQGAENWVHVKLYSKLLPTWLHILLIVFLLVLSGLFSGLNLGLMSLNKTDLKIIANTGSPSEREYAAKIAPVRDHGNFLLCCLLFSNVLVNASLTILVDDLTSGIVAIVMSTLAIVIFGEIIPQAICSRHGLAVGARTILITRFFMAITSPLAYPLSKLLDVCLGEEIGNVYTRERLKELLQVTKEYHGLGTEEVGIISGALDMKSKLVRDIMTRIDTVYMISIDSHIDFETLADINYQGFSRIPVYDTERENIVAVLNVKQLTLLDGNDSIPIRTVVEYYRNTLFYVFENTRLDYMFKAFREGSRGHMAIVQRVNEDGPGDPYYDTVGVVTMEDVLEELLQAEIMDETDVGKILIRTSQKESTNAPFTARRKYKAVVEVQPQLAVAAVQYLATNVDAFDREFVSESIIQRLLTTNVFMDKPAKSRPHEVPQSIFLYRAGEPADSFIMILEGKVEVHVGTEYLMYEAGPFHNFGANFLLTDFKNESTRLTDTKKMSSVDVPKKHVFIPDYTIKVISEVFYIRVKYSGYEAARQATLIERNYRDPVEGNEIRDWEDEIEKVLNAVDEGMPLQKRVHMAGDSDHPPILANNDSHVKISFLAPNMDQQSHFDPNITQQKGSPNRRRKSEPGDKYETKFLL